jgi:predicted protein tyrosine phosphatase
VDTLFPFRIAVCGLEELGGHCETGVSHVLSILDPEHPVPEAFGTYGEHARLELRFHDIIQETEGQVLPREEHVAELLAFGRDLLAEPPADAQLLVHCHAGISRSTAAMSLILAQARPDLPAPRILAEVLRIREKTWPNLRVLELGEAMLGRRGELSGAAAAIYRHQLDIRPHLAEFFERGGRGREVEAARQASGGPGNAAG